MSAQEQTRITPASISTETVPSQGVDGGLSPLHAAANRQLMPDIDAPHLPPSGMQTAIDAPVARHEVPLSSVPAAAKGITPSAAFPESAGMLSLRAARVAEATVLGTAEADQQQRPPLERAHFLPADAENHVPARISPAQHAHRLEDGGLNPTPALVIPPIVSTPDAPLTKGTQTIDVSPHVIAAPTSDTLPQEISSAVSQLPADSSQDVQVGSADSSQLTEAPQTLTSQPVVPLLVSIDSVETRSIVDNQSTLIQIAPSQLHTYTLYGELQKPSYPYVQGAAAAEPIPSGGFLDIIGEPFEAGHYYNTVGSMLQLAMAIKLSDNPKIDGILKNGGPQMITELRRIQVLSGMKILDLGCGQLPSFALTAKALGAEVHTVDGADLDANMLSQLDSHTIVNLNDPDAVQQIRERTGGNFDFVTEHIVGNVPGDSEKIRYPGPVAVRKIGEQLVTPGGWYFDGSSLYQKDLQSPVVTKNGGIIFAEASLPSPVTSGTKQPSGESLNPHSETDTPVSDHQTQAGASGGDGKIPPDRSQGTSSFPEREPSSTERARRYLKELQTRLSNGYRWEDTGLSAMCSFIAIDFAKILLPEGPALIRIVSENEEYLQPRCYRGIYSDNGNIVGWNQHIVCAVGTMIYDPIVGEPMDAEEYRTTVFETPAVLTMSVPSTEIAEYLKDPGLWYSKNGSKHRRPFPTLADLPHSAIPLNSQNSIPDPDNGEEKDFHKISSKHGQRRMKPLRLPVEPIPEIPQEFKNVRWDLDTEAVAGLERLGEYMRNPQDNDRSKSIGSNGLVVAATAANGEQVVVKISRRSGPLSEAVIDREAVFQRTASSVTDRVPRVIEEGILPFQTTQYNNGISEQRDYAVIVSQLVPGKNLFDINNIIARPLTVQNAVRIYTPLAEGIDALGHAGIVHRDIKPGNVVSDGKEAYLVDFGTATKIGSPGQRSIGSPAFYTPEHTKTEPEFSAATNAYQFGLFILRELTRKNDFMPLKNLGDPKSFDLSELLKAGTYYYYVKNWFDKNFVPYSWREAFFGTLHELPQYRPSATEFMSMLDKASKRSPGYNS